LKGGAYMPKIKGKSFPAVRVEESLYEQTVKCANLADEYLSVYIRKAIKIRNKQNLEEKDIPKVVTVVDTPAILPKETVKQEKPEFKTFFKGV
jgi:hypothetical protein